MSHKEIYDKFCEWSPVYAKMVVGYKPWGSTSIAVWLTSGLVFKVKLYDGHKFIMQTLSKEDINKKYELNK